MVDLAKGRAYASSNTPPFLILEDRPKARRFFFNVAVIATKSSFVVKVIIWSVYLRFIKMNIIMMELLPSTG